VKSKRRNCHETEFNQYLKQIGISDLFYERTKDLVEGLNRIIGEDVLISLFQIILTVRESEIIKICCYSRSKKLLK
jgi:hypothetical protein